jgi:regulator of sirC expression with transglutaminase-like and TPR domain
MFHNAGMDEWTFRDELRLSPVDVPRAALYYAREIAYPDLAVADYVTRLDELATAVRPRLQDCRSVAAQSEALAAFLFEEEGFHGNVNDYFDPRNSFLNEVLERRLGIPITLSVLFVAVARRAGLPAYGVNLPGHFVVAVHRDDQDLLFDPFHGGVRITFTDCVELVRSASGYQGRFHRAWLTPAPAPDILSRMLRNLRMIYIDGERWRRAIRTVERLQMVQPEQAEHRRDLGLLYYQTGQFRRAALALETYFAEHEDAPELAKIQRNTQRSFEQWARLN